MQIEELCTLLKAVSESGVQSFTYEENGVKVSIEGPAPGTAPAVLPMAPIQVQTSQEINSVVPAPEGTEVKSPLVGVFYAAPSEDAEPFVHVGDAVKTGQTIAIVEAMKLMNEIEAEADGVITEILVKNAQSVEFGQPLFRIREA